MRRWLVTGGVGFIGSHVSCALLERGDHVRIVDDFSNEPYPAELKRRHASELTRAFGERLVIDEACVTEMARADGVDGVIHLAGLAGVRPSFVDPARYAYVNVVGTARQLEAAQRAGCSLFVLASSSSVYGDATPLPASEEAPAVLPQSPYAATKRSAELVVTALARKTPTLRCPMLRFFTVYGPRQRPEMAISSFLRRILAGEAITMFGDGSMKRDFTHVDDIVQGVLAAIDRAGPGARAYNLGSGAPISLAGLVDALGRAAGKKALVEHAPVPLGDVEATFADITRARTELGWVPTTTLDDGLRTVVDWLRSGE